MYYIISAASPDGGVADRVINTLKQTVPLFNERRDGCGTIVDLPIDKHNFKIGSLDQLMALNETCMKLDGQLENVCKKVEKVAFETMPDANSQLTFRPGFTGTGSKFHKISQNNLFFSLL